MMRKIVTSVLVSLSISLFLSSLAKAELSSVRNYYSFNERLVTTGQPDEAMLKRASKEGIEVVINLVPPSEMVYNPKEGEILQSQGIEYVHIPVNWRDPDPKDLKKFLSAMNKASQKKVLIHCWSNARASAFAYAHIVSQSPQSKPQEWERLRKVWTDVAGYNLDEDEVWKKYLRKNLK